MRIGGRVPSGMSMLWALVSAVDEILLPAFLWFAFSFSFPPTCFLLAPTLLLSEVSYVKMATSFPPYREFSQ